MTLYEGVLETLQTSFHEIMRVISHLKNVHMNHIQPKRYIENPGKLNQLYGQAIGHLLKILLTSTRLKVLLGIVTCQNDPSVNRFVLPIAITGWGTSFYHYMSQKVPGFSPIKPCTNGVPCNAQYINWAGLITTPFLSLTAFSLIIIFIFLLKSTKKKSK